MKRQKDTPRKKIRNQHTDTDFSEVQTVDYDAKVWLGLFALRLKYP